MIKTSSLLALLLLVFQPSTRVVNVTNKDQFSKAILNALPGDSIVLAPGTYSGFWKFTKSGTQAHPIYIVGPRSANIGGTGVNPTSINLDIRGSWITLYGFAMRRTFQPIFLQRAQHVVIRNLEIDSTGNSGIALKLYSKYNILDSNYIHNTGITQPVYGEGIYIGTASNKWCAQNSCKPDRTDSNTISHNVIGPGIGSQMIDEKDGVTGTRIIANKFNGAGRRDLTSGSWVMIAGSRTYDSANVGINPSVNKFPNGYYIEVIKLLNGASTEGFPWGQNNRFVADTLNGNGAPGRGFLVGGGSKATTKIPCGRNVVTGFASLSNLSPMCQ